MNNSDVVRFGHLIEERVAKACAHQRTAEQDYSITVWIAVVCIRESKWSVPPSVRIRREDVASVKADVAEEVEYRHVDIE